MAIAVQKGKIVAGKPTSKLKSKAKVLLEDKKASGLRSSGMLPKKKMPKK